MHEALFVRLTLKSTKLEAFDDVDCDHAGNVASEEHSRVGPVQLVPVLRST